MKKSHKILGLSLMVLSYLNARSQNNCAPPTAEVWMEVNNVRAYLRNGGDMFWTFEYNKMTGYEIPKYSGNTYARTKSLFLGGIDANSQLHTAGQTYRQFGFDFWPGPISNNGTIDSAVCKQWDRIFKVSAPEIINAKNGNGISSNIINWPALFANYVDVNSNGIYEPNLGDYPVYDNQNPNNLPGEMNFWIINDVGNEHTAFEGAEKLGVEIHITSFAYASNTSNAINNSTYYRYKVINKSVNNYNDFIFGIYSDFQSSLGDGNDYIGCDLSTNVNNHKRNLMYFYNASYHATILNSIGTVFLNTGKKNGVEIGLGTYAFMSDGNIAGINAQPRDAIELWRYLNGFWADGQPYTFGTPTARGGTIPVKFAFPGDTDPLGRGNWYESDVAGDRATLVATNPTTFQAGEVTEKIVSVAWAELNNGNPVASRELLRLTVDTIHTAYHNNFAMFSVGVNANKKLDLKVYPNPVQNKLYIDGLKSAKAYEVNIYSTEGSLVKQVKVFANQSIDIEDLANGVYYIDIENSRTKFLKLM